MSIQTNFNPIHCLHSTHTSSVEETVVVLTTTNSDLPEAKRSRGFSYENSETSSASSAISQSALETFCPVRTIESSASFSSASSSSSQVSQDTVIDRNHIFNLMGKSKKFLRRTLILEKLLEDANQLFFKPEKKIFIGLTNGSEGQQSGYISIETTKECIVKFFQESIYQNKDSVEKKTDSIIHYFTNNLFFKISVKKHLNTEVLLTIPLPEKLITSIAKISSNSHFIIKPESHKKISGIFSKFFRFLTETAFGSELSSEQYKLLMDEHSRVTIPIVSLTSLQAKEIDAPNTTSFGSLVDYAVWKTRMTQESLENGTVTNEDLIPNSSDRRIVHNLKTKEIQKIFNAFAKEIYYSETPIHMPKAFSRTKRAAPSASTSSHSVPAQTSGGVSTVTSRLIPIRAIEVTHRSVSSCLSGSSLEPSKIESIREAAEALISLDPACHLSVAVIPNRIEI